MVEVEEVTEVTPEVIEAVARLVPQLSRSATVPTDDELAEIVSSPATVLLAARSGGASEAGGSGNAGGGGDGGGGDGGGGGGGGGRIVGLLTLVLFRIPTGVRAWIEDVVVEESERGKGVGDALAREAVRRGVAAGSRTVDLTSRPSREAANRLYRRLGFVMRETNVYRFDAGG